MLLLQVYQVPECHVQIANALAFLHTRQPVIVHRDLKPANVMLSSRKSSGMPTVKLSDFGLATAKRAHHNLHSPAGDMRYMAPEVQVSVMPRIVEALLSFCVAYRSTLRCLIWHLHVMLNTLLGAVICKIIISDSKSPLRAYVWAGGNLFNRVFALR